MAVVALMAAVLCVLAPFSIPIGPIPISLATFGLYLTIIILGGKKAITVCLMYLLIGFVGLPVFSGFSGGPMKLLGPTGGYFFGYLLLTAIAGWFVDKFQKKRVMCLLGFLLGTATCYVVGTAWLAFQMQMNFVSALMVGVVPFLIGDVIKMVMALWIGTVIRGQMNRAGFTV
ncbi:MAG: biotin transporter BioY [Roseburia sp.]|nr:biotin transporter BioY [Roseburia sp.]